MMLHTDRHTDALYLDTPGGGDLGVGGASEGLSVPEAELDRRTTRAPGH